MFVAVGLAAGLAFGLPAACLNRIWGTVLSFVPVVIWFVVFAMAQRDGYSNAEAARLAYALCGVLIGLFSASAVVQTRRRSRRRRARD
ncbi:hypothetical protein [Frondihabitans sp. PAMC 28766]|uniref:hypothetical protein n=1 Tax=Frondihabitans sp. PAMC 28766 TaxID=1795630 RepID=UPI0012FFA349|nr:hypothetical protein [Frondihabitans sp. PAMC 28766]